MQNRKKTSRFSQKILDLFKSIIDFIYPPICIVCGKESDLQPFLCKDCLDSIPLFDDTPDSIRYHEDHPANSVKALYYFDENLQKLIHQIKYRDAPYMAEFLGKVLGEHYKDHKIARSQALIPVPLHSTRKRERTYNQSACLARGIAKAWEVEICSKSLKRGRYTNTQTKLNKKERQENMRGAFVLKHEEKLPDRVCIIDDVFTTGATCMEIARTLRGAGVKEINILCLATPFHEEKTKKLRIKR
ncbi:MAG: ComF family protein [Candidatus Neomarinimicrobiota bacterium]